MSGPAQLTVEELKARIDKGEKPMILDVRNPEEFALCQIPGAKLIPLGELPQRVAELDPGQEIIVHCKLGGRSSQAQAFLMQQGFRDVKNLSGGIIAWADRIDPSIQRY